MSGGLRGGAVVPTPIDGIVAEGVVALEPEAGMAPVSGFAARLKRLIEPSPRQLAELHGDVIALVLNGAADSRTGGAATQAELGESVADCVYALTGTGGFGGESPLMRLVRSVVRFFTGLRRSKKSAESAAAA